MNRSYRGRRWLSTICVVVAVLTTNQALADEEASAWQDVLDTHVDDKGRVSYGALKAQPSALEKTLQSIVSTDLSTQNTRHKKAFFLNAYNAYTVQLMSQNWPIQSIRDLDQGKVWDTRKYPMAGRTLTLNELENGVLRKMNDPRIHAGLNCASKGCAPLHDRAFRGDLVGAQLDKASLRWIRTTAFSTVGDTNAPSEVRLSQIFDWYGDDFTPRFGAKHHDIPRIEGKEEAAINFIVHVMEKNGDRPALAGALKRGQYTVRWMNYDWSHNGR